MKTLVIIRHAEAGWGNFRISDFERPLTEKGHQTAEQMAVRLLNKKIPIDLFVSSTALRTRQTTEHFCKALGMKDSAIQWEEKLYHAPAEGIELTVAAIDNQFSHVAIVCHNPGITEFVNELDPSMNFFDMPTCGIFAVESDIQDWSDFCDARHRFLFFENPKNL